MYYSNLFKTWSTLSLFYKQRLYATFLRLVKLLEKLSNWPHHLIFKNSAGVYVGVYLSTKVEKLTSDFELKWDEFFWANMKDFLKYVFVLTSFIYSDIIWNNINFTWIYSTLEKKSVTYLILFAATLFSLTMSFIFTSRIFWH